MADLRIVDAPVLLQESITDDVKMPTGGLGNYAIRLGDLVWYVVTKENLASKSYVDTSSKGVQDKLDSHVADKTNPHQVTKEQVGLGNVDNTADVDKPISKAMESALLEKADKTKTYSKEETANLISGMITTTTSGHKGYLTYADAVAAKSTLTANTVIEVLTDKDSTKNGVYIFNGTDFTKSVVDYVVKSEVKDIIGLKPYVNIADLSKAHKGYYYNYQNGMLVSISDDYTALGLYKIEPDTKYQVPATYVDQTAFFDSNMQFISGIPQVDVVTNQFTTPTNARYIGLSVKSWDVDKFMLAKASEYPDSYTPYRETISNVVLDANQVNNLEETIRQNLAIYTVNIADTSTAINKAYYHFQSGTVASIDNTMFNAVGLVEIEPSTKYQVPSTYIDQTAFFDASKKFIIGIAQVDSVTHQFTTPTNAQYVGMTVKTSDLDTFMLAKASEYPDSYVPYKIAIENMPVRPEQITNLDSKVYSVLNTALPLSKPNIIDTSKVKHGFYVSYQDGNEYAIEWASVMGPYPVEPNTEYRISSWQTDQIAFYDANNKFVGGIAQVDANTHTFTTPNNAVFIKITVKTTQVNDLVLAKVTDWEGETAEYGVKIKRLLTAKPKTTIITASPDLNSDAQFKGKNCVQLALDSITDASEQNRYVIKVAKGLAKITQANEYIGYRGYPCMICPKDWVDIVGDGIGETILWAELPYDDAQIGKSVDGNTYARDRYQAIYNYSGNSKISNLTIVAKNLRYTNHQDDGRGANKHRNYENVELLFKGNNGYNKAWGCGDHTGESTTVVGGRAYSDSGDVFAVHNNTAFESPASWVFENYNFTSMGSKTAIELQNDGSLLKDRFSIVGCSFGGMSYVINYIDVWLSGNTTQGNDTFDHAEWRLTGHSNSPFLFNNAITTGQVLRIKSKSTGNASVVRFDKASSAFATLIKNKRVNADTSINYKYDFVDGYLAKDGTAGLSGQALGCVDLSDAKYWYDNGVNYTSLGKRLGNLSSSAKSLKVIVDGVANTINFDKDYSAMSNTQILAEINAQLSNATADLYNYGRDYYPQIPDVSELCFNNTSTYIAKGSVVTKQGGFVKLANANDDVFGVALEDIPVMQTASDGSIKGQGLVLKRGLISADKSKAHFVLADNQNPSIGTRFAVSNGQLITDSNGKISVDVDTSIVSINC